MNNLQPKVDLVVDLQFGSTGKGLLCGYLSESDDYDTVITANMPNAGHTYIDKQTDNLSTMPKIIQLYTIIQVNSYHQTFTSHFN